MSMRHPMAAAARMVGRCGSLALLVCFSIAAFAVDPTNGFDFDGDGKADISVFRPGERNDANPNDLYYKSYRPSNFYFSQSGSGGALSGWAWGRTLDVPIPADYNGDGRTDAAIFRWFVPDLPPFEFNQVWIQWLDHIPGPGESPPCVDDPPIGNPCPIRGFGNVSGRKMARNFVREVGPGPTPTPRPQRAEVGEFQRINTSPDPTGNPFYVNTFYIQTGGTLQSQVTNVPALQSANYAQLPVPEDYDGDQVSEIAVFNTGTGCYHVWSPPYPSASAADTKCVADESGAITIVPDVPAPGDYNDDGRTDYAGVKADGGVLKWVIRYSGDAGSQPAVVFGLVGDEPVPADYDGDGATDLAVIRRSGGVPGNMAWYIRLSTCLTCPVVPTTFGFATDVPLPIPFYKDPMY